jgi:hypothetical protein
MLELCYELRTPFVMSVAANQVCDKLLLERNVGASWGKRSLLFDGAALG